MPGGSGASGSGPAASGSGSGSGAGAAAGASAPATAPVPAGVLLAVTVKSPTSPTPSGAPPPPSPNDPPDFAMLQGVFDLVDAATIRQLTAKFTRYPEELQPLFDALDTLQREREQMTTDGKLPAPPRKSPVMAPATLSAAASAAVSSANTSAAATAAASGSPKLQPSVLAVPSASSSSASVSLDANGALKPMPSPLYFCYLSRASSRRDSQEYLSGCGLSHVKFLDSQTIAGGIRVILCHDTHSGDRIVTFRGTKTGANMVFDIVAAVRPAKALRQLAKTADPIVSRWRQVHGPIRFYSGHSLGGWAAQNVDPTNTDVIRVTLNSAFPGDPGARRVLFLRLVNDPVSGFLFRSGTIVTTPIRSLGDNWIPHTTGQLIASFANRTWSDVGRLPAWMKPYVELDQTLRATHDAMRAAAIHGPRHGDTQTAAAQASGAVGGAGPAGASPALSPVPFARAAGGVGGDGLPPPPLNLLLTGDPNSLAAARPALTDHLLTHPPVVIGGVAMSAAASAVALLGEDTKASHHRAQQQPQFVDRHSSTPSKPPALSAAAHAAQTNSHASPHRGAGPAPKSPAIPPKTPPKTPPRSPTLSGVGAGGVGATPERSAAAAAPVGPYTLSHTPTGDAEVDDDAPEITSSVKSFLARTAASAAATAATAATAAAAAASAAKSAIQRQPKDGAAVSAAAAPLADGDGEVAPAQPQPQPQFAAPPPTLTVIRQSRPPPSPEMSAAPPGGDAAAAAVGGAGPGPAAKPTRVAHPIPAPAPAAGAGAGAGAGGAGVDAVAAPAAAAPSRSVFSTIRSVVTSTLRIA